MTNRIQLSSLNNNSYNNNNNQLNLKLEKKSV